ncbi:MAG: diadenosine tetraphosphatase, partial [Gammaproteobacteria bacterium]|nr:diadenosine tetraphosphatase [Gammaproteobacteria bacterium]
APTGLYPWYELPTRHVIKAELIFGHWAALQGLCPTPHVHAIDTGCVWGGPLTALRLQDKKRFTR